MAARNPAGPTPEARSRSAATRRRQANERKAAELREDGYFVLSREEMIKLLAEPMCKDPGSAGGIPANYIRGYMDLPKPD